MCFNNVLFIGPDFNSKRYDRLHNYHNYGNFNRGWSDLLKVYKRHITPFHFIAASAPGNSGIRVFLAFCRCWFHLCFTLLLKREIKIVHFCPRCGEAVIRNYLLILLVSWVFQKKVVYHVQEDGDEAYLTKYYFSGGSARQSIVSRMINQVDMIICPSESGLAYFKSRFHPKMVFIVRDAVETVDNLGNQYLEGDLIKVLYLCDIRQFDADVIGNLKDRANDSASLLLDLLKLMQKNESLYKGRIALLIGGIGKDKGMGINNWSAAKRGSFREDSDDDFGELHGNSVAELNALIEQRKLKGLVRFVDSSTDALRERLLAVANITILPPSPSGNGLSLLEALNYGTTIIAQDNERIREGVFHGINGFLCPVLKSTGIEEALDYFLLRPGELAYMCAQSRKHIKNYDIQEVLLNLKCIYSNLLN